MQTVAHTDASRYTYRVTWSTEDDEFLATCAQFPSLSWLASSQIGALQGLEGLLREVIADMEEQGEQVPKPFAERSYSGKFNVASERACTANWRFSPPRMA
jgi:predicted RNase H-like HicB family nuclease